MLIGSTSSAGPTVRRRSTRYHLPRPIEFRTQAHWSDIVSEVALWIGLITIVIAVLALAQSH